MRKGKERAGGERGEEKGYRGGKCRGLPYTANANRKLLTRAGFELAPSGKPSCPLLYQLRYQVTGNSVLI